MSNSRLPAVACPAWLSPAEQASWWSLAGEVHALADLTEARAAQLAALVRAHHELVELDEFLRQHGLTRRTRRGPVARPEVRQWAKAARTLRYHAAQLGLTPASRARRQARGATNPCPTGFP